MATYSKRRRARRLLATARCFLFLRGIKTMWLRVSRAQDGWKVESGLCNAAQCFNCSQLWRWVTICSEENASQIAKLLAKSFAKLIRGQIMHKFARHHVMTFANFGRVDPLIHRNSWFVIRFLWFVWGILWLRRFFSLVLVVVAKMLSGPDLEMSDRNDFFWKDVKNYKIKKLCCDLNGFDTLKPDTGIAFDVDMADMDWRSAPGYTTPKVQVLDASSVSQQAMFGSFFHCCPIVFF